MPSETTLSIKEAADRYQRAEITIRRFVRSVVRKSQSKDRELIEPSLKREKQLKARRKPFSYRIDAALLEKHFGKASDDVSPKKTSHGGDYVKLLEETNASFKFQLEVKDGQIKALQQSVESLAERQREMNILMKGLQQQLLLTSGKTEEGSEESKKRAGWFRWWRK
jgi:hypothetical protein